MSGPQTVAEVLEAAAKLIAIFDEQSLIAQRIIVGGRSDTVLREEGNAAIAALRVAVANARGGDKPSTPNRRDDDGSRYLPHVLREVDLPDLDAKEWETRRAEALRRGAALAREQGL